MTPTKILAPVDFSPGSKAALDYAVLLARALNASVTLLHVYDAPRLMGQIVPGADNAADTVGVRDDALARLNELRATLGLDPALVDVAAASGDATKVILERARTGGFDLIVIGTHGRSGINRILMGSVAEGVVRRAEMPVVTVHLPRERLGG